MASGTALLCRSTHHGTEVRVVEHVTVVVHRKRVAVHSKLEQIQRGGQVEVVMQAVIILVII